jgi:hypothetical protein
MKQTNTKLVDRKTEFVWPCLSIWRLYTLMLHKNLVYFDCGSKLSFALRPKSGEDPCEL